MKKILFACAAIVLAIASLGGINLNANAATLTPDQIAAIEQQLESMRATARALSAAAAAVAPAAPIAVTLPAQAVALSPQETVQITVALDSLKGVLVTIQAQLATHPRLREQNLPAVIASLRSIGTTLAAITGTLSNAHGSAIAQAPKPGAQAAPFAPSKGTAPAAKAPTASAPLLSAAAPATTPVAAPALNAETAQAASTWSWKNLNWPLVAVVSLIVLAVALWLFWPENKERTKGKGSPILVSTASQPRPTVVVTPLKQNQNAAPQAQFQSQQQQRKPA